MGITAIQAHRGASAYRPENTMEAFALALSQGADGIELDVHLSADGQVVVAHDERLERVSNGTGRICDHSLAELKKLDFSKTIPDSPPCRIPTLEEVYDFVRTTPLSVNVELKTTEELYPKLPEKLVRLAREYAMEERVIYSSFNHYSLAAVKQLDPAAKLGLLYAMGMIDPWVYASYVSAHAIHPHYAVVAALPETVARCHEQGIAVNVWTVDKPEVLSLMFRLGVDAVITNTPDVAAAIREKAAEGSALK